MARSKPKPPGLSAMSVVPKVRSMLGPRSAPRSMTLSRKNFSAIARLPKVTSRTSTPLAAMVNSIDWKPSPLAKPLT